MTLQLDPRQRAMLAEMGVRVWLPGTSFETVEPKPLIQPRAAGDVAQVKPHVQPLVRPLARPLETGRTAPSVTPRGAMVELHAMDWPTLVATANQCSACALCAGRKNSTLQAPALPTQQAHWMVVGDAPDELEDRQGRPFAGDDGVLLGNILKALGLKRLHTELSDPTALTPQPPQLTAYISNALKCRPPMGRNPQAAELGACSAYLEREIALVQPKVIVAMGRFAIQMLLKEHPAALTLPLGKQRAVVYAYQGTPVVVSYAPKNLFRTAADKGKAWEDWCLAADVVAQNLT